MSQVMVIYNADSTDAWCGAWIMDRCFNGTQLVSYKLGSYLPVVDNRTVFTVGVPLSACQMNELELYSHRVVMLDHHPSTRLRAKSRECFIHDDSRSSGRLAYDWCVYRGYMDNFAGSGFQNNRDIAKGMHGITMYVEDSELGRNKLPNTKHINLCIDSYDKELKQWDMLARRASVTPEALTNDGIAIDRYISKMKEQDGTPEQEQG